MQTIQPSCDEFIYHQISQGDQNFGVKLFLKKYKYEIEGLRRFLLSRGAISEVDDIIQDALIIFWKNLKRGRFRFLKEGCLLQYLFSVSRNHWHKKLRNKNFIQVSIEHLGREISTEMFSVEQIESETIKKERALAYALERLDKRSRRLITGYYFENTSYENLAIELQLANGHVARQRAYIKRLELKKIITNYQHI